MAGKPWPGATLFAESSFPRVGLSIGGSLTGDCVRILAASAPDGIAGHGFAV
jgi:hypothetical protein